MAFTSVRTCCDVWYLSHPLTATSANNSLRMYAGVRISQLQNVEKSVRKAFPHGAPSAWIPSSKTGIALARTYGLGLEM